MVDQIIRPSALPRRTNPVASEIAPVDNGTSVAGSTLAEIVNAGRPLASRGEAEAGANAEKAMTPLTVDQKIEYEIGRSLASKAQGDKADSAIQEIIGGANTTVDNTDPQRPIISSSGNPSVGFKSDIVVVDGQTDWRIARNYKTVSDLLADDGLGDMGMGYAGSGANVIVSSGDIITAQGFRYEVAASGASDNNVVTAGGVKLYVRRDAEGRVTPLMWGAFAGASASVNQPAFVACAAYIVATGAAQIVPAGTYDFNANLAYPQGTVTYWDNVIMLKQYDGEGIRFGSGPSPAIIHGNLRVEKGLGGSGPTPNDGNFATAAGTVAGDHGVVFAGRIIQTGEVAAMFTHDTGIVLEASANGNHSQFNLIRGLRTGKYGVEGKLTRNDNAVWDINIFAYGCWDSGIKLPDDYEARNWTGLFHTEANCRKSFPTAAVPVAGDDFYAGKLTVSDVIIYAENTAALANEIRITANSERVNYFDVRGNKTIIDATRKETIINTGMYLVGNNPVASYVRALISDTFPTRYVSDVVAGIGNVVMSDIRTYGSKVSLALNVAGVLTECFDFRNDGNFAVNRSGKGIRLVAPNGTTVRFLTINNSGEIVLSTTAP